MSTGAADGKLQTWHQIADYLNVSVRTAQTYAREKGLPVRRLKGEKTVVNADRAELDAWLLSSHVAVTAVPIVSLAAQTDGQAAAASRAEEPARRARLKFALRIPSRLVWRIGVAGAAGLLVIATFALSSWSNRDIAMVNVDGPALIARCQRAGVMAPSFSEWNSH